LPNPAALPVLVVPGLSRSSVAAYLAFYSPTLQYCLLGQKHLEKQRLQDRGARQFSSLVKIGTRELRARCS
jgi:hypothetical protein